MQRQVGSFEPHSAPLDYSLPGIVINSRCAQLCDEDIGERVGVRPWMEVLAGGQAGVLAEVGGGHGEEHPSSIGRFA